MPRGRAHQRHTPVGLAGAFLAAAVVLGGCASSGPVTLHHDATGASLALPAGFVDRTAQIPQRGQERPFPGMSVELLFAFSDESQRNGCRLSRLTTFGPAAQRFASAQALAQAGSRGVNQHVKGITSPWWTRLQDDTPAGQAPLASQPATLGPYPGWLVVTQQNWNLNSAEVQAVSRQAILAADQGEMGLGMRRWVVAQCSAVDEPSYVGSSLDELVRTVQGIRWPRVLPPDAPVAEPPAPVPQ